MRVPRTCAALLLAASALLGSCALKRVAVSDTFIALGAYLKLTLVVNARDAKKAERTIAEAGEWVKELESRFDYRREGGALERFNRGTVLSRAEDELLFSVIAEALEIAALSGGAFDPTILPVVRLWGFDTDSPGLPPDDEIREALKSVGYRKVEVSKDEIRKPPGVKIDLSGIAQGKVVDLLRERLRNEGYGNFLLNASGDIYASGRNQSGKRWRIAIQDPVRHDRYAGIVEKTDTAIVTSGDYERFFAADGRRYCHILDPTTGYPPTGIRSVTILSRDTYFADAIATAVFVMGSSEGLAFLLREGIEGYLIFDGTDGGFASRNTPGFWE